MAVGGGADLVGLEHAGLYTPLELFFQAICGHVILRVREPPAVRGTNEFLGGLANWAMLKPCFTFTYRQQKSLHGGVVEF